MYACRAVPLIVVALAACGPVSQKLPRTATDLPPPNETPYSFDSVARGRIVFDNACIRCHRLETATETAPAMREVARRYRQDFAGEVEAVERVAAWIGAPSADCAVLPASAIAHWKVMPRVALDRDLALDVGHFVWSLGQAPPDTATSAIR